MLFRGDLGDDSGTKEDDSYLGHSQLDWKFLFVAGNVVRPYMEFRLCRILLDAFEGNLLIFLNLFYLQRCYYYFFFVN